MELSFEQIRSIARGVVRVEQAEDKVCLYRFTEAQEEMYRERSDDFYRQTFSTAGVVLEFDTDSKKLSLAVEVTGGSSRNFFVHSFFSNERRVGQLAGEFKEGEKLSQRTH